MHCMEHVKNLPYANFWGKYFLLCTCLDFNLSNSFVTIMVFKVHSFSVPKTDLTGSNKAGKDTHSLPSTKFE